jgi:hydroxyacylglutathione hydrolase
MFFKQIYEPGLAHASYMVGCQATGECLVIDAKRDVDTYIETARKERLRITHLAETHIHADFLAGTRELAELTKAQMYLSDEGGPEWQYEFDHVGLRDGSTFMVGNIKVQVMHTPGHTPEHICFLVTDTPATSDVPVMMFSGDFVFVGDVGRPDLLKKAAGYVGTMEIGARQLWKSMERFRALPDHIQVHPAHGAGSACGKALGSVPSSTVGYEKLVSWAFRHTDEDEFVADLLSGQPEPPTYFAMMKRLNKVPRALLTHVPAMKQLGLADAEAAHANRQYIVDTRRKNLFAAGHIPGSYNIQFGKSFSNWAGWLLNYEEPFVLIADAQNEDELMRKLMRIGLDNVAGYFSEFEQWAAAGHELASVPAISLEELQQRLGEPGFTVVDVRAATEYAEGHIPGTWNVHVGYLRARAGELPRTGTLVLSCQSGDRSCIASSVLQREGFTNVQNFLGGIVGWEGAGAEVEFGEAVNA